MIPWLRAFALTLAVEVGIVPWLLSRDTLRRRVTVAVLANALSHPLVWLVFPVLGASYTTKLVVVEAFAVASEAVVYRFAVGGVGWSRALAASALANAASLAIGLWLRHAFGWV